MREPRSATSSAPQRRCAWPWGQGAKAVALQTTAANPAPPRPRRFLHLASALMMAVASFGCGGGGSAAEPFASADFVVEAKVVSSWSRVYAQVSARAGGKPAELAVPAAVLETATLELETSAPTTYRIEPAATVVEIVEDTPTRRVVRLPGLEAVETGEVAIVFSDPQRPGSARVRLAVEARRFLPGPRRVGETFVWQSFTIASGAPLPDPRSGEQVVARQTDIGRGNYMTQSLFSRPGEVEHTWYTEEGNLLYRLWGTVDDVDGAGQPYYHVGVFYTPSSVDFAFPLFVGKTWEAEAFEVVDDDYGTMLRQVAGVVEAREQVTVPAGRYDSLRIAWRLTRYLADWGDGQPYRTSNEPFDVSDRRCWWSIDLSIIVMCDRPSTAETAWGLVEHARPGP